MSGERVLWTVSDRYYPDVSAEYIRLRKLLIYSNCNKFYRRDLVMEHRIRFDEEPVFGEDRLFNYEYLNVCGSIITSSSIMPPLTRKRWISYHNDISIGLLIEVQLIKSRSKIVRGRRTLRIFCPRKCHQNGTKLSMKNPQT